MGAGERRAVSKCRLWTLETPGWLTEGPEALITGFPAPLIPYCTDVSLFIAALGERAEVRVQGYEGFWVGCFFRCCFSFLLLFFPTRTPPVYLAHITLIPATALSLCMLLLASEYLLFFVASCMYTMQLYHIHSLLSSPKTPTNMSSPPLLCLAFLLFCFNPLSPVIATCWNVNGSYWLDLVQVARATVSMCEYNGHVVFRSSVFTAHLPTLPFPPAKFPQPWVQVGLIETSYLQLCAQRSLILSIWTV